MLGARAARPKSGAPSVLLTNAWSLLKPTRITAAETRVFKRDADGEVSLFGDDCGDEDGAGEITGAGLGEAPSEGRTLKIVPPLTNSGFEALIFSGPASFKGN